MDANRPLVTIRVLTYNSARFVLETLESIKAQSYERLELIVSDDCSQDNTVAICEKWIAENSERFENIQVLTVPKNTGVAANCNRGFKVAHGTWFKGIAGDDCLVENAIEEYVKFVEVNHCDICVADMMYINENSEPIAIPEKGIYGTYLKALDVPYEEQLRRIYNGLIFPGPPMFFSKSLVDKVGGCNENYPFAEEWSFHYGILSNGYRVFPLNKSLVKYRIHEASLSTSSKGRDRRVLKCMWKFYKEVIFTQLVKKGKWLTAWHLYVNKYTAYKSVDCRLYNVLFLFSPLWYVYKIKAIFGKKY